MYYKRNILIILIVFFVLGISLIANTYLFKLIAQRELDLELNSRVAKIEYIVNSSFGVEDVLVRQNINDSLLTIYKNIIGCDILYVLDSVGNTINCSIYDSNKTLKGNNYQFRYYFKKSLLSGKAIQTAVGVVTKKRGIFVAKKFIKNNETKVIVAKYNLSRLDEIIKNDLYPIILYFDDDNKYILSSNIDSLLFKKISYCNEMSLDIFPKNSNRLIIADNQILLNNSLLYYSIKSLNNLKILKILYPINLKDFLKRNKLQFIFLNLFLFVFLVLLLILFFYALLVYKKKKSKDFVINKIVNNLSYYYVVFHDNVIVNYNKQFKSKFVSYDYEKISVFDILAQNSIQKFIKYTKELNSNKLEIDNKRLSFVKKGKSEVDVKVNFYYDDINRDYYLLFSIIDN